MAPGITIISESGQFIQNLTPQGIEDHDVDYLPDGRIVFKTNHWSSSPQFLTGIMNEDGINVQQLSFASNVSDHDQFGNDEAIIFERFPYMKGPAYFEASLMTRAGKILGRFIPDVTQIKFIDWRSEKVS